MKVFGKMQACIKQVSVVVLSIIFNSIITTCNKIYWRQLWITNLALEHGVIQVKHGRVLILKGRRNLGELVLNDKFLKSLIWSVQSLVHLRVLSAGNRKVRWGDTKDQLSDHNQSYLWRQDNFYYKWAGGREICHYFIVLDVGCNWDFSKMLKVYW